MSAKSASAPDTSARHTPGTKRGARPFVMVDGSSYLYRAYHALPPLSNASGEPTGAVYGVVNMLLKLLREYEPEYVAVLFDARGKTFRDELYEQYKAQRPPMPDELRRQVKPLHDIVRALGLPLLQVEGVEADDVIGSLACRASRDGLETVISTIDKDMAQLVDDDVLLVNTMFDTVLDRDGVRAKFGVEPEQIVDYIALVGDTSDNIPGVPGVGQKTASALLQAFGSIENTYANLERLSDAKIRGAARVAEKLERHRDDVTLSRQLATIRRDLELEHGPRELRRGEPDHEKLRELYRELGFGSLLRQLPAKSQPAAIPEAPRELRYDTVRSEDELERWIARLESAGQASLHIEGSGPNYMAASLVGIAVASEPGCAAYVPVAHAYPGAPAQLSAGDVLARLGPLLEREDLVKVGHDLKFAAHLLARHGIALRGPVRDTMLESYVLNSTATRHDMESIALTYLRREVTSREDLTGKGAKQIGFAEVALEQATPFAAQAADVSLQLDDTLRQQLAELPDMQRLYEDIEQPLEPVLQRMEQRGVLVDAAMLQRQSGELEQRLAELETAVFREAGTHFNLGSPKQLQDVLFGSLGLPVLRKTRTGQPSTAEDVLEELAQTYDLPRLILEHRGLSKLKSTYCDTLPRQVDPTTGRVHTTYHQAVAATGRLSSSDPNLQNIPIRTPEGRRIRQAFIAPEGYRVVAADYSQIELRIMAHLSGDENLLAAFARGRDIHQATAAEVFGVALEDVEPLQRRSAKAINFGLIYGMSAFGLARQLGIERRAAQAYVDLYFERYPRVKAFMDHTRAQARERGYVETVFGRRLYLPEIRSRNVQRRQYAERSAINAPMQGTAADIIKRAMVTLDRWLGERERHARLIMQVHDELVFEVAADRVEPVTAEVTRLMSTAAQLAAPLKVEAGAGSNWDEAH